MPGLADKDHWLKPHWSILKKAVNTGQYKKVLHWISGLHCIEP